MWAWGFFRHVFVLVVLGGAVVSGVAAKPNFVECMNPSHFNLEQKKVLVYAYHYGSKENLGYEMAAIAWKESCAGAYRVNFDETSAGIYHAYIPAVLKFYNEGQTPFMKSYYGDLLIRDRNFASRIALDTLVSFKRIHKGNLKEMIRAYYIQRAKHPAMANQEADEYYQDLLAKIKTLQSLMPTLEQFVREHEHKPKTPLYAQSELPYQPPKQTPKKPPRKTYKKPSKPRTTQHHKPKPKVETTHHTQPKPKKRQEDDGIFLMQEAPVF
ncbi:hypothetical protein [Helicobacter bizzozeronii]|uniref:hypothetical protein n=1 Tax=Helicobacter bizzozeronii TaxID=56877 RepID=UPI000CEEA64D|nr:hypothetical protein [Helicobacter bizzozeronii]